MYLISRNWRKIRRHFYGDLGRELGIHSQTRSSPISDFLGTPSGVNFDASNLTSGNFAYGTT